MYLKNVSECKELSDPVTAHGSKSFYSVKKFALTSRKNDKAKWHDLSWRWIRSPGEQQNTLQILRIPERGSNIYRH